MKIQLILSAVAVGLAGCGSPSGNESGASGGSAAAVTLQPGEWEMKMEVVNVAAEGLPAGMVEGMKKSAGKTTRTCMTPEEAKGPKDDLFAGDKSGNCKSEGFSWSGGRIKGKIICGDQSGAGKTVMTMDGSYQPQRIDLTMKSETDVAGKPMTMEMRVSGRRIGECTPEQAKEG